MTTEQHAVKGDGKVNVEGHAKISMESSFERSTYYLSLVVMFAAIFSMGIQILAFPVGSLQQYVGIVLVLIFLVIVIGLVKQWLGKWIWQFIPHPLK